MTFTDPIAAREYICQRISSVVNEIVTTANAEVRNFSGRLLSRGYSSETGQLIREVASNFALQLAPVATLGITDKTIHAYVQHRVGAIPANKLTDIANDLAVSQDDPT